jgi:hypothetical protein
MVIIRVLVEELLYRVVTGQIPVLKCLLSGACGYILSCLALNDIVI